MNSRLSNSRSGYLRKAVKQPVNWYTWSEEAFQVAKAEDKPIFSRCRCSMVSLV